MFVQMNMDTLIRQLGSSSPFTRTKAREQLIDMGAEAVNLLVDVMRENHDRYSVEAATLLSQMTDTCPADVFLEALNSSNPLIGNIAVEALENRNYTNWRALIEVLEFCRPMVQLLVVKMIEKIGDPEAAPALIAILEETQFSSLRITLLQALGRLGNPLAIPIVNNFTSVSDSQLRKIAQVALAELTQTQQQ